MPQENRGPWSKKFENRCCRSKTIPMMNYELTTNSIFKFQFTVLILSGGLGLRSDSSSKILVGKVVAAVHMLKYSMV